MIDNSISHAIILVFCTFSRIVKWCFLFLILCPLLFDSTVYFQEARSALIFLYFINGRTNHDKRVLFFFWFFHQELRLSKSIGGNFHKSIRQYSTFRETLKSLFSQCSFQSHHSCHHSAYSFDRMRGYFQFIDFISK